MRSCTGTQTQVQVQTQMMLPHQGFVSGEPQSCAELEDNLLSLLLLLLLLFYEPEMLIAEMWLQF